MKRYLHVGQFFQALEQALVAATKKKYDIDEMDVRVSINRKSGDYDTFRRWTVVADHDHVKMPVKMRLVMLILANGRLVMYVKSKFHLLNLVVFQTIKQVIVQKFVRLNDALVVDAYRQRVGELVSGEIEKITRDGVIVDR